MRKFGLQTTLAAVFALLALLCSHQQILPGQSNQVSESENIAIDTRAPSHPFPHYWEQMFGSGRALLSMRQSYRHDLKTVKAVTEFRYVRFHAIFDRDVGVYNEDKQGHAEYNFTLIDQIYDGLLANGIRPFVELSFMPPALASASADSQEERSGQ